jgi:hypothetical protein
MKERTSFTKVIAAVAVLVGVLAITSAQAVEAGKAVVRSIKGKAQYAEGGAWMALKVGQTLKASTQIKTGNDSQVDLFLDQNGPLVRLLENTTLGIDKLCFTPTGADTVVETQLDLKSGRIVGIVKKLAATSKYEVKTPNGVAGIRGTEYSISASGDVQVVTGSVVVVYVKSDGSVVTQVVGEGEMFDAATGKVRAMSADEKSGARREVQTLKGMAGAPPVLEEAPPVIFISPALGATAPAPDK